MFDTMTIIKAAAAFIGATLFLLLASWGASGLFSVGSASHGEGGEEHAQAYSIAVPETGAADAGAEEEQIDFGAMMAAADPAAGEGQFGKCKACHKIDGTDGVGPHLNGVVGRPVASMGEFAYSDAMVAHADEAPDWTPEALQEFLTNPRGVVSGTKMAFAGIKDAQDRADLIAFLQTQQ